MDEAGAVVPDVNITIINTDTGLQRRASTTSEGYFIIPLLEPGSYALTAEMPNFASVTINEIVLQTSTNSLIQILLRPKPLAESIDVQAGTGIGADSNGIDITSATIKQTITNKQVISLPILTSDLGRNALGVLPFLVPGVSPTTTSGSARSDANRLGSQMSINGSRPTSISFYLEGGDNNDHGLNQAASPLPNPDVLHEFSVITNNYQADLGRSSGGVINAVIKSGTNKYRGNIRHYLINEALNARGFFDPRVPLDRLNAFGAQLGGPLNLPHMFQSRGRAFFFFDYEGTRSRRERLDSMILPSERERVGDFSSQPPSAQPHDPLTGRPFSGGVIPADLIDPISQTYLKRYVPLPNDGERTFRQLLLTRFKTDQVIARLDFKPGQSDVLSVSFLSTVSEVNADSGILPLGSRADTHGRNQNLIVRQTHTFAARAVNQLTAAATRPISEQANISPGAIGTDPGEIGFTGVHPQTTRFLGVPSVSVFGTDLHVLTAGAGESASSTWQVKDDFSYVRGSHALKFGAEVRGFLQNTTAGNDNGSFTFFALATGDGVADFLLGIPNNYSQTTGSNRYPRQQAYYVYAMDDWRLRTNLTINLGVRYELSPPMKDKLDQVSVFRPGEESKRFPDAPAGLLFVGDPDSILGSVPRGLYPTDRNNLAPRLGVAYSPRPKSAWLRLLLGDGQSAIRAGAGTFYDQTFGGTITQVSASQPFSVSQSITSSQIRSARGSFANPFGDLPNPWPLDLSRRAFIGIAQLHPIDPAFRTAYSYHYNLTLQRELPWSLLLEAAYVGASSFKLDRHREINEGSVGPGANPLNLQSRRRYPHLGSILLQESSGRARYNSPQLRLMRRLNARFTLDLSYTYSKSLDDGSSPFLDSTNPFRWARSSFDRTHGLAVSFSYDFPKLGFKGVPGSILNGWQLSGITELRTGLPIDIRQIQDSTLTGRAAIGAVDIVGRYERFDPRRPRTFKVNGLTQSANFFFSPNAFRTVLFSDYTKARAGTLGRNVFDGGKYFGS